MKYTITKSIVVSKEEYIKHLEEEIKKWEGIHRRREAENEKALKRYTEKLERSERECQSFILKKKEELEQLRKSK